MSSYEEHVCRNTQRLAYATGLLQFGFSTILQNRGIFSVIGG